MKIIKILILSIALFCTNYSIVVAQDCSKLDKLSKEYAECNAKLLKKNAEVLKNKATNKIKQGKKQFNNCLLYTSPSPRD